MNSQLNLNHAILEYFDNFRKSITDDVTKVVSEALVAAGPLRHNNVITAQVLALIVIQALHMLKPTLQARGWEAEGVLRIPHFGDDIGQHVLRFILLDDNKIVEHNPVNPPLLMIIKQDDEAQLLETWVDDLRAYLLELCTLLDRHDWNLGGLLYSYGR